MARKIERIEDLTPDPQNANKGTERGVYMLEESLRNYGAGRSILADKNGVVIAGNKTLESCASLGIPVRTVQTDGRELVVVQRTDLDIDEKAARELAYADNRASETGLQWDFEQLQADLDAGIDLSKFWQEDELKALLAQVEPEVLPGEDPGAGEIPVEPKCKAGDLWTLGKHRLLCGDSTCITDVEKVMGGERARMVWTDPPYGVSYADKNKFLNEYEQHKGNRITEEIANDHLGEEETEGVTRDALSNIAMNAVTGASCYVACPPGTLLPHFIAAVAASGFEYHHSLVWVKSCFVFGRCDYHYKHEVILYGWKPDGGHYFVDDHTKSSVFEFDKPRKNDLHPTMKPVELIEEMIKNSSKPGEIVYDCFMGSGSTLIAAENTGRRAVGIEISPRYCDVILERWAKMTGKEPVLEGGRTWSEVKEETA